MSCPTRATAVKQPVPVTRPGQILQRGCACGKSLAGRPTDSVQCDACRDKQHQAMRRLAEGANRSTRQRELAPPIVEAVIRSPGQPLDAATRAFMEPRFGRDFSTVRVHTDSEAAESARAVDALAYTVGSHIAFAAMPDTSAASDLALVAHELTHVVQQSNSGAEGPIRLDFVGDPAELEARSTARRIVEGAPLLAAVGTTDRQVARVSWTEKLAAVLAVGPFDAWKAKQAGDEAMKASRATKLAGPEDGPQDAWRHCFLNCRMGQTIGADQAKEIGDLHEVHGQGKAAATAMDLHNNEAGRGCGATSCDTCCTQLLQQGQLRVVDPKMQQVISSNPQPAAAGGGGWTQRKVVVPQ